MTFRSARLAAISSVVLLASTVPSWAYLDPGTGSLLLQSAIAAIAAGAATVAFYWHRTKLFFARLFRRKSAAAEFKKDEKIAARRD